MSAALAKPRGRPKGSGLVYGPADKQAVLDRMAEGLTLDKICAMSGYPSRIQVWRWITEDEPFAVHYAQARELLADYKIEEMLDIIDKVTPETANADKVKIGGLQWIAGRLNPRKYGDRVTSEITGPNGGPLQIAAQVIDARSLNSEARAALREALRASLPAPAGRTIDVEPESDE